MSNSRIKTLRAFIIFNYFLIISCAQNPNIIPSSYSTMFNSLSNSLFNEQDGISPEVIANIPYASSLINFNKSSKSLIILQSKNSDVYTWVSSDKRIFFTENGRIVGTVGLPNDLYKIKRPEISFSQILDGTSLTNYIAYYSFRKPELNNLRVEISIEVLGEDKIILLGQERNLILVEERLVSKKINWKTINRYWVDPENYFVYKSQESISPKLPVLTFQVTKKPAM
jgi:hypothetical protein